MGLGFTFRFAFLESWRLHYMHHRRRIAFSFGFKFGVFTNGVDKGQRSELCMSCLFGRALEQWRLHFRSLRHGRACVQSRHLRCRCPYPACAGLRSVGPELANTASTCSKFVAFLCWFTAMTFLISDQFVCCRLVMVVHGGAWWVLGSIVFF